MENKAKNILIVIIVILVGLGSFGLGKLSSNKAKSGINIEYPIQEANTILSTSEPTLNAQNSPLIDLNAQKVIPSSYSGKVFFASKIGHKYYSIGCSGGKTIKAENKIFFASEQEAIQAGYQKSASCK